MTALRILGEIVVGFFVGAFVGRLASSIFVAIVDAAVPVWR